MSEISSIANEIESGNLRVTSRNSRNFGHADDEARMIHSAKRAAAGHPGASSSKLETELFHRGWEPKDAARIAGWFTREQR
jgi:hypothetical protein